MNYQVDIVFGDFNINKFGSDQSKVADMLHLYGIFPGLFPSFPAHLGRN